MSLLQLRSKHPKVAKRVSLVPTNIFSVQKGITRDLSIVPFFIFERLKLAKSPNPEKIPF